MTLKDFLINKMSMSGPYQPVVIKKLLESGGKVPLEDVARLLASLDRDSVDYYKSKLKVYPRQVLKKHNIAFIKSDYIEFASDKLFKKSDVSELINICDQRIAEYYNRNVTEDIKNTGWGLKRVKLITNKPYCELCGQRPGGQKKIILDIDHVIPRSKGGTDDLENLQVLCHECNRGKSNNLLKSAKKSHDSYLNNVPNCIFCFMDNERIEYEDDYIFQIKDKYPVTNGHTLIIPKRHFKSVENITDIELLKIFKRMKEITKDLKNSDASIEGFNVGFNIGEVAGQTVFHTHFHIIPRRKGDVQLPEGGIRNVIPGKGKYR